MGAGNKDENASELLLKCIDGGRVDVLCSLLSQMNSVDCVSALLANGVNPCVQNEEGKTPYQLCKSDIVRNAFVQEVLRAVTISNSGRICQLISSGVAVDSVDSREARNTLLNWASEFSTVDIVRILCDSGATIDLPNAKGETPLLTAVRRGDEGIVKQLLAAGANPSIKSEKGEDAFSLATAKGGSLLPVLSMDNIVIAFYYQMNLVRTDKYTGGKPESWTDLLWPQPKLIHIFNSAKGFALPKDNRLKIYFDDSSVGCPTRMMQAIQISSPLLSSIGLDLEYRGHKLLQLATRLSYCKANYLFVNFEIRTTDRYQLPYTNRDLFHMMQVCEELFVTVSSSFLFGKSLSFCIFSFLPVVVGDDGYLCAAADSTAKKALLAAKLSEKSTVLGTVVCDLSTGCEAMPPSLSYMSLLASVGVAWNSSCDMKKFAFLLPSIAAHHLLMDGDMVALFEQAVTLGRVEHQLTRFAYGLWRPIMTSSPNSDNGETQVSGFGQNKKMPISVFVEMILNPENLNLERLTPVIFKVSLFLIYLFLLIFLGFVINPIFEGWYIKVFKTRVIALFFRYNPENVTDLGKCVQAMVAENEYDRDILLTVLKLYQLNPDKYDEIIVRLVLLKTLMVLPSSDFALAKCLIDTNRLGSQELKRVFDLGGVLESCDFSVFWKLMKGEYKPSTEPSEHFKVPQEVPRMVKQIAGFEEAVRIYACRVISVTFQNIEKSVLSRLLGGANDKQINEYAKKFGWEAKEDGVYFIANHEATIRTRNIDEKLQFTSVSEILRNMPGTLVLGE
uniref:Eukaryotic translation initiation factor 3 subunit K n=1 Tax=Heterorhabditis bacteriophora TaxID=37862 RepID=A0A1I7XMK2_HETBA